MKKFSLTALLLFVGILTSLSVAANAQDSAQAEFERKWYDICFTQKNKEQCLTLSKELMEKYPSSTYKANAEKMLKNNEVTSLWDKFKKALDDYYAGAPDVAKLERLYAAGDDYLKVQPDTHYVIGQQGMAGAGAAISQVYKDLNKAKSYAEKALQAFEPAAPPNKEWKPEDWSQFREAVQTQLNQFLGFYHAQPGGDQEKAIAYLNKAIAIKGKDGAGWKDHNNYWLRANIYQKQYEAASKEYAALSDTDKTGEVGKAALAKINPIVDKMIADYARVVVTATRPEAKPFLDAGKEMFNSYWNYRTGAADKAPAYLKNYEADPTIPDVAVPAKAEDTAPPVSAPTAKDLKISAGKGVASGAPSSNGGAKAKPAPAAKKRGRRK
jgi:hypothetical protein